MTNSMLCWNQELWKLVMSDFNEDWWYGCAPKTAAELAECLLATQKNKLSEAVDFRTPWEKEEDTQLVDYELTMYRESFANMKQLGM